MPITKATPTRSSLVKSDYSNELFAMTIGSNILHWRKYKGLSQQTLASKSGITQASISEIENADGNPTIETISKIAQALEVNIDLITRNRILRKMIETIDYMTKKISDIDILKAMKLLYFTDLESVTTQGNKFTGLQYIRYSYGPFSQDIYQLNDVFEKNEQNYISQNFQTYISLSSSDQKFLDKIIDRYGQYISTDLMDLSYETPPMQSYIKGDNIGMGKVVL